MQVFVGYKNFCNALTENSCNLCFLLYISYSVTYKPKWLYTGFSIIYYRSAFMNIKKHLEKTERLEETLKKLDTETDWESIVEIAYGIALNYIAIICEIKLKKHVDTHKGLPKFLDDNSMKELATSFRELDVLRQGRWYGSKHNGETAEMAISVVEKLKSEVKRLL